MSPLRYQKWLRLNEVRRPMLNEQFNLKVAIRHLKLKQGVCGMATHTRAIYQYSSHF